MVIMPLATVFFLMLIEKPVQREQTFAEIKALTARRHTTSASFDRVISELSRRYKVCIVCEGLPFYQSLDGEVAERLQTTLNDETLLADDKIMAVANAFDYSIENSNKNCFVLSKKFTNSGDLPEVSFDEVRRAIQNIRTYINDVDIAGSPKNISTFFASLTEQQKQKIKTGMSVSEFNLEQKETLRRFAWTLPLAGADNFKKIALRLQGCRSPKASFAREEYYGAIYPLYKGPFGLHHEEWKVVLGLWVNTQAGGGTTFNGAPGRVDMVDDKIVTLEVDPTTPRNRNIDSTQVSVASLTLGTLPTKLKNCLPTAKPNGKLNLQVDECISGKHIYLFGEGNVDGSMLVNSIAKLYNLRTVTAKDNQVFLTTQIARQLRNPNDFSKEIHRLLPISFWRALDNGMAMETKRFEAKPMDDLKDASPEYIKLATNRFAKIATRTRLYTGSVRRLRELVEPLLDKTNQKTVRMLDAPPEALDQVALSSLITLTNDLLSIPDTMPTFINYFDQAKVSFQVLSSSPKSGAMTYTIWCIPEGEKGGNAVTGRFDGIDVK